MPIKILASALSPFSARLRIASNFKKLDLAFELPPGSTGSPELRKINPFGQVPVMLVDGQVLVESQALLEYLEDAYPEARALRPAGAVPAARARMIAMLFDNKVFKAFQGVFAQLSSPKPDAAAARAAFDDVTVELERLVTFFDSQGPAVANQWTTADCAMAPFAFLMDALAPAFGATSPTQRVPRFSQWWALAREQAEIAATLAHMEKALQAMMAAKKAAAAAAAN